MTDFSKLEEGGDAYRNWFGQEVLKFPMPENPYPVGSKDNLEWEWGFDSAMDWQLYGQYEVD